MGKDCHARRPYARLQMATLAEAIANAPKAESHDEIAGPRERDGSARLPLSSFPRRSPTEVKRLPHRLTQGCPILPGAGSYPGVTRSPLSYSVERLESRPSTRRLNCVGQGVGGCSHRTCGGQSPRVPWRRASPATERTMGHSAQSRSMACHDQTKSLSVGATAAADNACPRNPFSALTSPAEGGGDERSARRSGSGLRANSPDG